MSDEKKKWFDMKLQSLDILVCSGNGDLSKKIMWFNRLTGVKGKAAELSHTARIYKGYLSHDLEVVESTTLNSWTLPPKKGVQRNPFEQWLDNYNGKVWAIQLDFERNKEFYDADFEFWQKHKNDRYENGILGLSELLLCEFRLDKIVRLILPKYRPLATKNPHCSELIVKFLQWHKFLSSSVIPSRFPPNVFWPDRELYKYIKLPIARPVRIK